MPEISDRTLSQITNLVRIDRNNEPYVDIASLAVAAGMQHDEVAQHVHMSNAESKGAKRVEMHIGPDEATPFQMTYSYYLNCEAVQHLANQMLPSLLKVLLHMMHGYMLSLLKGRMEDL